MSRPDSENVGSAPNSALKKPKSGMVLRAIAAGRISAVTIVVPTIVSAACAIITENKNDEGNKQLLQQVQQLL